MPKQLAPFTLSWVHLQDLPMKLLSLFSKWLPLMTSAVAAAATNAVAKEAINVCGRDGSATAIHNVTKSYCAAKNVTVSRFILNAGAGVVLMREGRATSRAKKFAESLRSSAGVRMFANWA